VLLAGTAALLLALGIPSKAALAGAGFAFLGAAVTRIVDLARESWTEPAEAEVSRQRDLDETRRVAYMALAARAAERYELTATIVNALAHHGSLVDPDIAMRHVIAIVNQGSEDTSQSEAWLAGTSTGYPLSQVPPDHRFSALEAVGLLGSWAAKRSDAVKGGPCMDRDCGLPGRRRCGRTLLPKKVPPTRQMTRASQGGCLDGSIAGC
jgi:hypothetical protein